MTPDQTIDYAPLLGIDRAWSNAIKKTLTGWRLGVVLLGLAVCVLFVSQGIFQPPLAVVVIFFVYVASLAQRAEKAAWLAFAVANGWEVDILPLLEVVPPSLLFGHSQSMSPVIRANIQGHDCMLASYKCVTGEGKSSQTHNFTVAVLSMPEALPHILLLAKNNDRAVQRDLQNAEELHLEGDFNNYFKLQVEKGQEIDVLTIITPDVMQTLVQYDQTEDIEMLGNALYFIAKGDERGYKNLPGLIRSVAELNSQLSQNHDLATPAQPSAL